MAGPVIHTYRAAEPGLFVNSYLVEGESGVVVVDTNLLASDIEALGARLAALNKPLRAIFVTHAHPDHFNGVSALVRDGEVPVYAAASVARVITEIADAKRAQWKPVYGQEWPAGTYYPNTLLADREQVQVDEMAFAVREIGPAESHADSYLTLAADGFAPVAFTGDLAFHGTHPYTADGHTAAWLTALGSLGGELAGARRLYPGHGDPAGPGLFGEQRRYLLYYREIVARLGGGRSRLSDQAKADLAEAMQTFLPGAPLTWMVGLGADAVAAELTAQPGPAAPAEAAGATSVAPSAAAPGGI